MKFRNKLLISFCISIFAPILLAMLVLTFFFKIQVRTIQQTYGILERNVPEFKYLLMDVLIAVVVILLLTACMLSVWIYTSLLNPIKKLQVAAQNIKEGNLDFTLEVDSEDEIGELCRSFEEMRQRLKESAEEKISGEWENKALINNIAHDLKTPITALKGYAEGLIDGVADTPEKQEKYIRTIYNKANEMDTLINELTLYAKIDTNRIPYNFADSCRTPCGSTLFCKTTV